MRVHSFLYTLLFILISLTAQGSAIRVNQLRCEYLIDPVGIDMQQPRFSWQIESDRRNLLQSGYQIRVYDESKPGELVWDSKKISSANNSDNRYAGAPLQSQTSYRWQVRVYDQQGKQSPWSEWAHFETGLLHEKDWQAKWISSPLPLPKEEADFYTDQPAPLFRKSLSIQKPVAAARLYIAGLGYYDASVNGKPVSDEWLNPGWTNFDKQIQYRTFDVTPLLQAKENQLDVLLGNGFYNPLPMPIFKPLRTYLSIGKPCLKAQLHLVYQDGSTEIIATDESWQTTASPILRNNVYLGERYDARQESKPNWQKVILTPEAPKGKLTAQLQPAIRVREVVRPVRMAEVRPGTYVFDMGKNFAGVARIRVQGEAGTTIQIRYGEDVYSDGNLNVMTSVAGQQKRIWNADWQQPGQPQTAWQEDRYTLKGIGEECWNPRFTFHGFRYIEVTGWPGRPSLDQIEGLRLSADMESNGEFSCNNALLNQLHQVIDNTFLSNLFSVQSDCPAREKFGYGGDIVAVAPSFCWLYNMENFYRKAIQDYANDQRPQGGMTETAPFNGIADMGLGDESGPIGWQLAFGYMQKQLYDYYGDTETIRQHYPTFVKQIEFLRSKANEHCIETCINDHESLEERIPALFATAHYYHHVQLAKEFATILEKTEEAKAYQELSDSIKTAFIKRFVTTNDGRVGNGTQAAQAFALLYGLVPDAEKELAFEQLLAQIERDDYHVRSGIFGVPALLQVLQMHQRNDVAAKIVLQPDFPGWGHMLNSGATTLWETWKYSDNVYSHNHPMFGSVAAWIYESLGGLQIRGKGFREISIQPQPAEGLTSANCTYQSINGKVQSAWNADSTAFEMQVVIPGNTTATVAIPATQGQKITESGKPIETVSSLTPLGYKDGYAWFKVGSGNYLFKAM